eukprot:TRINITY_DN3707_c0_g1_i15.p1 TRINITY_DN3707_c0_g1~~TRINITY_DN3707_c0_g1_i15.p1  ORF type:complete len:340 (-),score=102.94 TRINITY_DN3707_c0_g1_i15:100-1119(-)
MVYALDHVESTEELAKMLMENIEKERTPGYVIARLYLVSDILYNCAASSGVVKGWTIRTEFESYLPEIFEYLNSVFTTESGKLTSASLTEAVDKVIKMWDEKAIYDSKFTNGLKASFSRPKEFTLSFIRSTAEKLKDPEKAKKDPKRAYIFPKLIEVEQYLREEYKDNAETLEKKCRLNGVSTKGTFDEVITRMLNLEYQVLKEEYSELKKKEREKREKKEEEAKAAEGEMEVQLIALRNRLMDIQKLYLGIDSESIDGSPITAEDINLLDLSRDLLSGRGTTDIEADVEDTIDGVELTPEEIQYLKGHEDEVFITIEVPINSECAMKDKPVSAQQCLL